MRWIRGQRLTSKRNVDKNERSGGVSDCKLDTHFLKTFI